MISNLSAINSLTGLSGTSSLSQLNTVKTLDTSLLDQSSLFAKTEDVQDGSFGSILDSVMTSLNETNVLQNSAEAESIKFALGESTNTHDLIIAQTKANTALQYTVAVRDKMIEAYQQIMQMQI